jgi:hypothetical protein
MSAYRGGRHVCRDKQLGVQCSLSPAALIITRGSTVLSDEPMLR